VSATSGVEGSPGAPGSPGSSKSPGSSGPPGSPGSPGSPDWQRLRDAALAVRAHAYAPYSRFSVGAAGLADDGRVVVGCNVENASYGLTLCAECGVVSALAAGRADGGGPDAGRADSGGPDAGRADSGGGGGRLVALVCLGPDGEPLMPCGRCRQLLWEFGGPRLLVWVGGDRAVPLSQLLPDAFGPADLARADSSPGNGQ
jgi:cytidine deaminase